MIDRERGLGGCFGIVGGRIVPRLGAAMRAKRTGGVVSCVLRRWRPNEGDFHEGMNLAALWDLPVIFVCENNLYAQFTPHSGCVRRSRIW